MSATVQERTRPPAGHSPGATELNADRLTVRFDGLAAISQVSLSLRRGEILGLIGPNGAGKTTLVNCLTGFQRPTEGTVFLGGDSTAGWSPAQFRRRGIARTFQAGRLFGDMSVLENAEVTGVALGLSRRKSASEAMALLHWIGMADKGSSPAGILPYTDQRRLSIVRALMLSPAFVLMDEPAAGMSDAECEDLMALIIAVPTTFGCGVLLIEHNMKMVMGVSGRVHVLDGGKTLAEGTPQAIQRHEKVMAAYLGLEA
ncbi:ABC transporter ATP-binding protein [Mesorhizobium sp. M1066]|uniref:ABC transporter ATP-binding protein n=1 Tax=unclassified Mesorhizobium TaxID=325217 RepID=UPI0033385182